METLKILWHIFIVDVWDWKTEYGTNRGYLLYLLIVRSCTAILLSAWYTAYGDGQLFPFLRWVWRITVIVHLFWLRMKDRDVEDGNFIPRRYYTPEEFKELRESKKG